MGGHAPFQDGVAQRTALHEFHDEVVESAVVTLRLDHPHDARMRKPGHDARTTEKTRAPQLVPHELRVQHLNGHFDALLLVARLPHGGESALPMSSKSTYRSRAS